MASSSVATTQTAPVDWLEFRHWVVSGGTHATQVALAQWPKSLNEPSSEFTSLEFDQENKLLRMTGALSAEEYDRWTSRTTDEAFLTGDREALLPFPLRSDLR